MNGEPQSIVTSVSSSQTKFENCESIAARPSAVAESAASRTATTIG